MIKPPLMKAHVPGRTGRILMSLDNIHPYWSEDERPHFYTLTETKYDRTPWKELFRIRGITTSLLDNLVSSLPQGAIIAGGFVASLLRGGDIKVGDIDIFFTNTTAYEQTYQMFINPPEDRNAWSIREYNPSITWDELRNKSEQVRLVKFSSDNPERIPIQLIKMVWYNSAEHVIDSFDFTVCQFAIDGPDLIYNPLSLLDLAANRIVSHRHHYPADTLYRLIKYAKKGFNIPPQTLIKIAADIKAANESDPPTLMPFYT